MSVPHSSSKALEPPTEHWFAKDVYAHDSSLKAYVRGTFPAVRDVDDLVQESYLRVWKTRALQPIHSAKALLFTVARRLALDSVRSQRRSRVVDGADLDQLCVFDGSPDAAAAACRAQEIALLSEAIDKLPPRCREVFVLRRFKNLSQKEVAQLLGLSEQTVQVQMVRGLRKIEAFLSDRLEGKT